MEGRDEEHRTFDCEGRPLRWHYREGNDLVPFRLRKEEIECREISMTIMRDGSAYRARAIIQVEGEGTYEWMAVAIAVLDMSVDMAVGG